MAADARPVRAEDALDEAALAAWLREHVDGAGDAVELRQFSGGSSNLTYLVRSGERELVLRRPPRGQRAGTAHDMAREYRVQRALRPHYRYVPEVLALCEDDEVIGAPFYVMERVDGVIPKVTMPRAVDASPAGLSALVDRFVAAWAELHAIDPAAAGLADFGRGPGYVARQVAQWSERYRRARTRNVPDFERVMRWLDEAKPEDAGACVIHNDFRLDNTILDRADPLRVLAVLDWELSTVGDPLMDLASSLAYWIQPDDGRVARRFKRQPTDLPGMPTRREVAARYGELTGRRIDDWAFYEVFGVFRLAAIAQQIYARYRAGDTRNPAFRFFWVGVRYAHRRCLRAVRAAGG